MDSRVFHRWTHSFGRTLEAMCCGSCCCLHKRSIERSVAKVVSDKISSRKLAHASKVDKKALLMNSDPSRCVREAYKITDRLGSGGFGAVFKAVHRQTKDTVAIKHIKKSRSDDDMQFLQAELESLLRLDHPNIAKFHRFFEDSSSLYLVTEFCDGGDFGQLLDYSVDTEELQLLFRDAFTAIAYCHELGVIHRDLKFENCVIHQVPGHRRVGKVIDFGLAAVRCPKDTDEHWLTDVCGTRFFLAPEVIDTSCPYGAKCDCWSLGVMLYILLTDEHPFAQDACALSDAQLFGHIVHGGVRFDPLDEAGVCQSARDLLFELLEKTPEDRMSARSALFQPWLNSGGEASTLHRTRKSAATVKAATPIKLEDKLVSHIRTFGSFSRFERAVLTLVAHYAEEKEVAQMRAAFLQLDSGRTGYLSKDELKQGLTKCGHHLNNKDFDELFQSLDQAGDGKVHYTEWLAATMQPCSLTSTRAVQQLYSFFDEGMGEVSTKMFRDKLGYDRSFSAVLGRGTSGSDVPLTEDQFKAVIGEVAAKMERRGGK